MSDLDVAIEGDLGGSDNFDVDSLDFSASVTTGEEVEMIMYDDMDMAGAEEKDSSNGGVQTRGMAASKKGNINGSQQQQDQSDQTVSASRRIRANVRETGFDSMKYYMKTMGNHDLLQKNEEIILAREIQILIKWEEKREELESQLLR